MKGQDALEAPVVWSPQPCVGPGEDMTRARLRSHWQSMGPQTGIIDFYGHHWGNMGEWAVFSNFFEQKEWPGAFDFRVPLAFCACDISEQERLVTCDFSEKAIMLSKAAAMGDVATYRRIAASGKPAEVKRLAGPKGSLRGFDPDVWDRIDCSVAFQVVFQKFAKTPELKKILMKNQGLFAEMTENDVNWGTGMNWKDPSSKNPSKWPGTNMLGWALTEVRALLENETDVTDLERRLLAQEAELTRVRTRTFENIDAAAVVPNAAAASGAAVVFEASGNMDQAMAKKIFKYVSGVLNGAFDKATVVEYAEALVGCSSGEPSFLMACDTLARAIDQGLVPQQGLLVLNGLANRLSQHGVPDSASLHQALARAMNTSSELGTCKGSQGGKT